MITAGNSITPGLLLCGAADVSSAPSSLATSQKPIKVPSQSNSLPNACPEDPQLENLLFDDFFNKAIHKAQPNWRDVVAESTRLGIPIPAFSTALSFFDGYRSERLPAALLQAQRDYFGAHTFRILPQYASQKLPEGKDIHINWVSSAFLLSLVTLFCPPFRSVLVVSEADFCVDWTWRKCFRVDLLGLVLRGFLTLT